MAIQKSKEMFIPISDINVYGGTWADAGASPNSKTRTAADAVTTLTVPIEVPRASEAFGVMIKNVKLVYKQTVAALDAVPTVTLTRHKLGILDAVGGVALASEVIPTTHDLIVAVGANPRVGTVTVTNPKFDRGDVAGLASHYEAKFVMDCAATTVLEVIGAIVSYTESEGQ